MVAFKVRVLFNLEVTRLRAIDRGAEERLPDKQYMLSRFSDAVCGKLGQTLPGMVNILLVAPDDDQIVGADVLLAMADLKARAERKRCPVLSAEGLSRRARFFKQFHQLSGIIVRGASSQQAGARPSLWSNLAGQTPIPPELRRLLQK